MYRRARRGPRQRRRVNSSAIPPEKKYLDCEGNTTAVVDTSNARNGWDSCEAQPASGSTGCLNCPAIGDAATNRDGKHIIATSFQICGSVTFASGTTTGSAAPTTTNVLLALVLNKQTNQLTINSEDVFTSLQLAAPLRTVPLRNLNFGKRFRILKTWHIHSGDRHMAYNTTAAAMVQTGTTVVFSTYLKMRLPINLDAGADADVANIVDNSIHLIWNSDPALASDVPTVRYQTRMRFIG